MGKLKAKAPLQKKVQKTPSKVASAKAAAPVYKRVKSILISQPQPETEKNPYTELLAKFKVKITFRPFITIEGIPSKDFRKFKVNPTDFTAVIFNSRNAIDHFFRICEELRIRMSQETKYFCSSEAVALYLQKYILYRKRKVFFANGRDEDLLDVMQKFKATERILLPCSDVHKEGLAELLAEKGFNFDKAVIYRTISSDLSDMKKNFDFDIIVFYSPSGVKSLFDNFPKFKQNDTRIAAFGKITAKAVTDSGLHLDIEAPMPQAPSMAAALKNYLEIANKKR